MDDSATNDAKPLVDQATDPVQNEDEGLKRGSSPPAEQESKEKDENPANGVRAKEEASPPVDEEEASPPVEQQQSNGFAASVASSGGGSLAEQPLDRLSTDDLNEVTNLTTSDAKTGGTSSRRGSSLELRKMPVNVLLNPEASVFDEELSMDENVQDNENNGKRNLMQRTCLNSKYTLQSQMMLSFGIISACTILMVVLVCIAISILSGEVVQDKTRETFDEVANLLEARATRYIAEDLTPRLILHQVVDVFVETIQDRFYGYPVNDDSNVPFFDTITQTNRFPIKGVPMPLDWQIEVNVNESNYQEHVQDRWHLLPPGEKVSTINAVFYQQGMCDPNETDPTSKTYFEGCTMEMNNITTGGIHAPSPTNEAIHRKASDLAPMMKAMFEYHQDLLGFSILFSNSGAGASMAYPAAQLDGTSTYMSIGCDWLSQPNPLDPSKPILSPEEVERCKNGGLRHDNATIPTRLYNPLDRGWCQNQILNPDKVIVEGPYLNAWSKERAWLLSTGQAVYDKTTNELIACTHMSIDIHNTFFHILNSSRVTEDSEVSVVDWTQEGKVAMSTAWDSKTAVKTAVISELDVGVTEEAYEQFYNLVDYDSVWNATEVQKIYEDFVIDDGKFQVKAYPIPPVPEEYDENYEPRFLVLFSVSVEDVFYFARRVDEQVQDRVQWLIILSVVVGLAGLVAVIGVLVAVSSYITLPLRNMNETALRIIDNFGEDDNKIEMEDASRFAQIRVKTELTEIVNEFQKMVRKFSGGAMVSSARVGITEVDNQFKMTKDFEALYNSREEASFQYKIEEPNPTVKDGSSTERGRQHFGSNILSGGQSTARSMIHASLLEADRKNAYASPLFRWIVILIVCPLLLSTITISAGVITNVSLALPDMINDAEQGLIGLQISGLEAFANLRAGFVSKSSEHAIRDLFIQTRYASWLLFGGVEVNAYPEMLAAAEACKQYESDNVTKCPYFSQNNVCDCSWENTVDLKHNLTCYNYSDLGIDARHLQKTYFIGSSQDVNEIGDRRSSSYPEVADLPSTTGWWEDQFDVPGSPFYKMPWPPVMNASASDDFVQGYGTTYQRMRTASASPMYVPMNDYKSKTGNIIGTYTAFEADGMYLAHRGCGNLMHATNIHWQSTEDNGAARLRGEICPLGLYGYDPRCRGWYNTGRENYLLHGQELHVTPAYVYLGNGSGQSSTAPLYDPRTKEHVGQVLLDFVSAGIYDSLDNKRTPLSKGGFPLLITMKSDVYGADVVLGPGVTITDPAKDVNLVVNARNETCDEDICGFEAIVRDMKSGTRGTGVFTLEDEDGSYVTYHVAFSPVAVRSLKQVNSSDFARGVQLAPYELYSLALAEPEASMLDSFQRAEDEINTVINVGLAILATVIVASAGLVVWLSHKITVSMTKPMYFLLELIRHINRLEKGEDPPEENVNAGYGSSEVLNVRMTMEKLYKIIQCANAAFFAGETEVAYEVFSDALNLFTRLDNRKAMGVANNNLGNTMLTFYRTMQATGEDTLCGLNKRQIIGKGMAYFHQAIQLGEKAYDDFYEAEGWSPKCLHFMQHLSNRYFNRAMFLLTAKDGHEKPKEIEELGLRDLEIARDMDVEIVDEGTQVGWDVRSAGAHMEVLLGRSRGHVTLLEMGYPDDWEVDEKLDNAFNLVQAELKKDSTDLFTDIGPAGRMQQVEFLLMRYKMANGCLDVAAQIAIRMLVEDEFIIPEAQKKAIEVMIAYGESKHVSPGVLRRLKEYRDWLVDAVDELDTMISSKEVESTRNSFVANLSSHGLSSARGMSSKRLDTEKSLANSVTSLRESMRGDFTMEAF